MYRHILEILVPKIEGNETDVVIVQVNGVKSALLDIAGHGLTQRGIRVEAHLWIAGVNGAGMGPVELPIVPKIDHLLPVRKDMPVNLKFKGVTTDGDGHAEIELGQLALIIMSVLRKILV